MIDHFISNTHMDLSENKDIYFDGSNLSIKLIFKYKINGKKLKLVILIT